MSNRAIQSSYASAEKSKLPLHNYQSLDTSHSLGASFNRACQEQNQLSSLLGHDTKKYLSLSEVGSASGISGPPRGFRKVESRSASLTMRSRYFNINEPSLQRYPISDLSQLTRRGFVFKNDYETNDVLVLKSQLARKFEYSNTALCMSRGDFSSLHPVAVTPLSTVISRSTASHIQQQGFNLGQCLDEGGRSSVPSLVCRQETVDHLWSMQFIKSSRDTGSTILEQGDGNYQSLLLSQEKMDIYSTFRKSVIPMSRKNDGSFLMLNDVFPKHNHSQALCEEQHQRIRNLSEIKLFPSWNSPSKVPKFEMLDQQLKETHLSGAKSSPVNKDVRMYGKLPSTDAVASPEEVRSRRVIPEIPDLNIALPDLPDDENLVGTGSLHDVQPSTKSRRNKCRKMSDILNLCDSSSREDAENMVGMGPVQPSITSGRVKRRKISDIINLDDSPRDEIVNKSLSQIRKGGKTKSALTFAGKEVIVLDSDDDADDGPASVKIGGSSSKEVMEVNKKTASDKYPSVEEVEKTEEITPHSWLRIWPLNPPTVQQTAQENPGSVVYKPQSSYVAFQPIREREVPSTAAMAVIASPFNKKIDIKDEDKGSYKVRKN